MDTIEHTELGNAIRLSTIGKNPYLRIDADGILHLTLQRFVDNNLPEPMGLELSAGQIVAMAGDYFTEAEWSKALNLPHCGGFDSPVKLGKYLIKHPVTQEEQTALFTAYNNLAAPDVTQEQIDLIYKINTSQYVSFSTDLNSYIQQIMLSLRVKNYGEMVTRDITHFSPWSIRAYVLGHSIALRYAQLASDLKHYAANKNYQSEHSDFNDLTKKLMTDTPNLHKQMLIELAHRYEAMAYSIELFTFHYYSDHFATGHMSMMEDLRVELPAQLGTWGNILANNLHNEINRVGVFTTNPYDPTPNQQAEPIRSRGDGTFDTCLNKENRAACIAGMTASLKDIQSVLDGKSVPEQKNYGGLEHLPDVDFNVRQHEPLLVLSQGKIYRRQHPSKINIISPSEYDKIRENPTENGYVEVSNKWSAFGLVCKLRLFAHFYDGKVQPVSEEKKNQIKSEEKIRSPHRRKIPKSSCKLEENPTVLDWRQRTDSMSSLDGLKEHGLLHHKKHKKRKHHHRPKEPELHLEKNIQTYARMKN